MNRLEQMLTAGCEALQQARSVEQVEEIRVRFLGRKGELTEFLHTLKDLPEAERREMGKISNQIKQDLLAAIAKRETEIKQASWISDAALQTDPTLPGRPLPMGRYHILNQSTQEVIAIFREMGFSVAEGPEVETDYYNFEAMNFPPDHPSRDMHDTFFIEGSGKLLLRTHTSPVQVRYMEKNRPPMRVIMPGKTYRCDDDATHSPMFNQLEGLVIDARVSFCDLKAVLTMFIQRMFGADAVLRFRPSYFPFTEPSAEIDMSCVNCKGKGCNLCKGTGWMEILGAGMVHPNVLRAGGIDPEIYSGFAFGMGLERITMLKYRVDNMRHFFENDLRFLRQF